MGWRENESDGKAMGWKVTWNTGEGEASARYETKEFTDGATSEDNYEAAKSFVRELESKGLHTMRVSPTGHWYTR